MMRAGGENGKPGKLYMDGVRRSIIREDLTEEDAEDRELWRSKMV